LGNESRVTNLSDEQIIAKANKLVQEMTLEEKASLCSGEDMWRLKTITRLGLSEVSVADGPHGLRKQIEKKDNLGIGESIPAVCFPTSSALACSFDTKLAYEVGKALGEECLKEGVSVILGPGANQKRSPLCGRNFEYFSEDPILTGEMAAAMINGVQSQGIGTSLKHFAVNNQESHRMSIDAIVDERALRETYLRGFEIAIKKGKPWTVMCAYNKLNGIYCSENPYLLTKILRDEWGFEGLVVSDWGAVNDRAKGVKAGLDLEMPGSSGYHDRKIVAAVRENILSEDELDLVVKRNVSLILKSIQSKKEDVSCDMDAHHQLSIRAEAESAVLLTRIISFPVISRRRLP
jgi:beta-glucosidase